MPESPRHEPESHPVDPSWTARRGTDHSPGIKIRRPLMGSRRLGAAGFVATLLVGLACVACSATAKHRVLSFFLDGVPPPGASSTRSDTARSGGQPVAEPDNFTETPQPRQYFAHTPYRDNRCGGCHDVNSGGLVRSIDDGLCLVCHADLVAGARFVHGPVAVNDCAVCHHYHTSPFPNLLLIEPSATCLSCHDRDDLTTGEHHATIGDRSCVDCHHPHGGDDRFFLKRREP